MNWWHAQWFNRLIIVFNLLNLKYTHARTWRWSKKRRAKMSACIFKYWNDSVSVCGSRRRCISSSIEKMSKTLICINFIVRIKSIKLWKWHHWKSTMEYVFNNTQCTSPLFLGVSIVFVVWRLYLSLSLMFCTHSVVCVCVFALRQHSVFDVHISNNFHLPQHRKKRFFIAIVWVSNWSRGSLTMCSGGIPGCIGLDLHSTFENCSNCFFVFVLVWKFFEFILAMAININSNVARAVLKLQK